MTFRLVAKVKSLPASQKLPFAESLLIFGIMVALVGVLCYSLLWPLSKNPLCRHLPVGLLFDLLAHKCTLPWNLIVHFSVSPVYVQVLNFAT